MADRPEEQTATLSTTSAQMVLSGTNASRLTPRHTRLKRSIALLLTFAAGVVDIVGYLSLYHTFTAHMTGTTVHLGNSLAEARGAEAIIAGSVVAAFVGGSIVGRILIEVGARNHIRSVASATLALECLLLIGFMVARMTTGAGEEHSSTATASLLTLLAAAMGIQTATLTRIGPLTVHTTFVTGMLNKLAQVISHALYAAWDALRCSGAEKCRHQQRRREASSQALFLLGIWLLYLSGAAAGTWLQRRWGVCAVLAPITALIVAIGADLTQPLSIEEEQEQSER